MQFYQSIYQHWFSIWFFGCSYIFSSSRLSTSHFVLGTLSSEAPNSESIILRGHKGPVYAVRFLPEGNAMLSASEDCTGKLL